MMTGRDPEQRKVMRAILAKLYAINSYYAHGDFRKTNPNGRRYGKKGNELPYKSYTLSPNTLEARQIYRFAQQLIWTDETENQIKAYVMRLRLSGELEKILTWEEENGRTKINPWREET